MTKITLLLCSVLLLSGCNIRAVAILETGDAVYGSSETKRAQVKQSEQPQ